MARLTEAEATEVFAVLVAVCECHRDHFLPFIQYVTGDEDGPKEYRFVGTLGFGGKLYVTSRGVRVDCYPEDRTVARASTIDEANRRLGEVLG